MLHRRSLVPSLAVLTLGASLTVVIELRAQQPPPAAAFAPRMTLTSSAFPDGAEIPIRYTQAGEQVSPAFAWTNVPAGTVSFLLHMHDISVARNRSTDDQVHWLVWNIPATATGLPEGIPKGAQLPDGSRQTSASGPVYRGPGAPAGGPLHHYVFELYALDTTITLPEHGDVYETRAAALRAIQGRILGKATYVGRFRRP